LPTRDPSDVAAYDEELAKITIGGPRPLERPIEIVDYDAEWADWFMAEAARIRAVLGERVLVLEHVGSTAVPGLPAKPLIDVAMELADTTDEPAYVPELEAAGYVLRVREPDWFEHRLFKGPERDINLHVFPAGCVEVRRMILFRDWLRASSDDRALYARAKRQLAAQPWKYMQQYADAKSAVVAEIMARAEAEA
jgi:GrpB-like predicted nucleotidyltransferase (UPF0157 family)